MPEEVAPVEEALGTEVATLDTEADGDSELAAPVEEWVAAVDPPTATQLDLE